MKFKLVKGTFREGGKVFKAGDVVESDEDLVEKWQNKFSKAEDDEEVAEGDVSSRIASSPGREEDEETKPKARGLKGKEARSKDAGADEAPEDDDEEETEDEDTGVESELGEDVTSDFSGAGKGLLVFKKGRNWSVAERDAPDTAVNESKLKTTSEVKDFLKKYK